ncbi:MAG TPA: thioredoxin, partial [Tepidisphaeraceae bacterium]
LVDFWAVWCPPCRAIAPVLEQLSSESGGKYVIGKLNVDENQQSASKFHIEGIPTLLIFKSGKLVDRLVGAHPKQTISQHLQAQL